MISLAAVQDTSLLAYLDVERLLGERQRRVYLALRSFGPCSNMELSEMLGWSVNRVTPRVMELRNDGLVVAAGVRSCRVTGHAVHTWRVS